MAKVLDTSHAIDAVVGKMSGFQRPLQMETISLKP